jgi:lambda family phage tail tape measure protein
MAMNMDAILNVRANVDGANKIVELNRGLKSMEGTAKGLTGAMRGLTGASAGLSGALGALAPLLSVAGLVGLAKGALDAGDKMHDLSQSTGVSVEALAKFKKAAAVSGTDIDSVGKALVKLSKSMLEASIGSKQQAGAFKALGINVKDSSGKLKSADAVMLEIADRFKQMPDGVAKTALALKFFGRAGAEMIPLLDLGGQAIDKLKVKMTSAFAEKADEYKDKLAMLSGKVGALGADLLIALLPALNAVTDAVSNGVSAFNSLPGPIKGLAISGAMLAIAWGPISALVGGASTAFIAGTAAVQALRVQISLAAMEEIPALSAAIMLIPGWGWALAGVAALTALGAALYLNNQDFKNWVDNVVSIVGNDFKGAMDSIANGAKDAFKKAAEAGDWFNNQIQGVAESIPKGFATGFARMVQSAQQKFAQMQAIVMGWWARIPAPIRGFLSKGANALGDALNVVPGVYTARVAIEALGKGPVSGKKPQQSKNPLLPGEFNPDLDALKTGANKAASDKAARLAAERDKLSLDLIASREQFAYIARQKEINDLVLQENDLKTKGLISAASATHLQILNKQEKLEELKIDNDLQKKMADARKEMDPQSRLLKEQIAYTDSIVKKAEVRLKLQQDQKLEIQATTEALKQQAKAQADALREIGNTVRYKKIADLKGNEFAQRQEKLDGLEQSKKEALAKGVGGEEEAKRLQEQIDRLKQSWAELDALANNAGYGMAKGIRGYLEGIGSLADSVANVTKNVFQGLEDKLVEFVTTGKASFKDFANEIIKQLIRITIQQAIMKPIVGALGNLFPFLKTNATGNVFAANGIVPFAMGGIVDRPTVFPFAKGVGLMGEAGPEAIMPLKRGADGKLGVVAGGNGGSTTINVSVDAKGSSVQGDGGKGDQLGRVIAVAVQQEMIKQKRPGGILA